MASGSKLLVIDATRFCAAVSVMVYHFAAVAPLLPQAPVHLFDPALAIPIGGARWTWCGWVGVEVFFVISGFVIALSAEGATAGAFLRRRVLRLVPAAWICSTMTAAVLLAGTGLAASVVFGRWGEAMLFIPTAEPIDGSYWTLGLETAFYLLCALALRSRAVSIERIGITLGALSVIFWAVQMFAPLPEATLDSVLFRLTLLPHGCFFGLGVVLYALRKRAGDWGLRGLAIAFFATGVTEILDQAHSQTWLPTDFLYPWLPVALFSLGVAAVARADALQAALGRALPPRTLALLGLATYPLYLLHQTIGSGLIVSFARQGISVGAAIWAASAAMITLALLVTYWAEPALRSWMAKRLIPARVPPQDTRHSASLRVG